MNSQVRTQDLEYREILLFFVPIAITSMLMMGSHSIISSALARTTAAATALAAYSVAQSIAMMFESPCFALRRIFVALLDDQGSFKTLLKVSLFTMSGVVLVQIAIAFTPVGAFIFTRLVGIPNDLLAETIRTYRIIIVLPIISTIRSVYQGLIIVNRRTHLLTVNMIARLVTMVALTALLTQTHLVTGAAVGAIVFIGGMGVEGILAFLTGRKLFTNLPPQPQKNERLTMKATWVFYIPLIAAIFLQSFSRPAINAGLARTLDAEIALGAYQVAWSFAWIFASISFGVHQAVLVFVKDNKSFLMIRKFVWCVGFIATMLLLVVALTPIGEWALMTLIGTTREITAPALNTIAIMAFVPLVITLSELYAGLLMISRRTPLITVSKIANLGGIMVTVYTMLHFFPQLGGMLAGISMLVGFLVELGVVYWNARPLVPRPIEPRPSVKVSQTL